MMETSNRIVPARGTTGFTLLELLIAIALGSMLIATAFGAFRVAQGYISVGNRMADETETLASGWHLAMDEVDRWRRHVDKVDDGVVGAKGFTQDAEWQDLVNLIDNRPTEDWWHWHDRFEPLDPADAGNADAWHGRQWSSPGLSAADYVDSHGFIDRPLSSMGMTSTEPVRETLHDVLGWYGYVDYLPTHAIFAEAGPFLGHRGITQSGPGWRDQPNLGYGFNYYCDYGAVTSFYDEMSFKMYRHGHTGYHVEKEHDDPAGGFAFAYDSGEGDNVEIWNGANYGDRRQYILKTVEKHFRPRTKIAGGQTERDVLWQPQKLDLNWNSSTAGSYSQKVETTVWNRKRHEDPLVLDDVRPKSWPKGIVSLRRVIRFGERQNVVEIAAESPVTGKVLALRFNAWGTTIRGARLMHGRETLPSY